MGTFFKLQISSLASTIADWLITLALTELFNFWYLFSGIIGTTSGGIIHFLINRNWVFLETETKTLHQVFKYVLAWIGYLGLSVLGLYFLTDLLKINYMASKIMIAILLGVTYNILMQKHFVFRKK